MARRKKVVGHHGGAWKVAYADFVTAMMAFFMVLWILGLSKPVKQAIAAYFNDPLVFLKAKDEKGQNAIKMSWPDVTPEAPKPKPKPSASDLLNRKKGGGAAEKKLFKELKTDLEKALKSIPEFKEISKNVRIEMTLEGMRIELAEDQNSMFFSPGSGEIGQTLRKILLQIGETVKQIKNKIIVEGHTDAHPTSNPKLSNWELSTQRANSARRTLEEVGLKEQVFQVRGFSSNIPLVPDDPLHSSNRRISMVVLYTGMDKTLAQTNTGAEEESGSDFAEDAYESSSGSVILFQPTPEIKDDHFREEPVPPTPSSTPKPTIGGSVAPKPDKKPDLFKQPDPFKKLEKDIKKIKGSK